MNKILLDKEKIINLDISEDTLCNIGKEYEINELNISLEDGVKFVINHYSEILQRNLKINILEKNNSEFIYNHSFKNNKEYNIDIKVEIIGNNSKNEINICGISDNGKSKVKIDGKVSDNTFDNEITEKVKLLNINDGVSYIYPNMFINTKNVVANHAASITNINDDYLFYLNSKGINDEYAKKIIIEGFLNNEAR